MSSAELLSLLYGLVEGEGAIPLHLSVRNDDLVKSLQAENDDLRSRLKALQDDFNRVEFKYRCEVIQSMKLVDRLREAGIKLDKSFFERPFEQE